MRLVQLSVCQVRSRINDVCHLAEVNVSILNHKPHVFLCLSVPENDRVQCTYD